MKIREIVIGDNGKIIITREGEDILLTSGYYPKHPQRFLNLFVNCTISCGRVDDDHVTFLYPRYGGVNK